MNPKVDWYFEKAGKWQKEVEQLREIAVGCDLLETLKWGCPCYMFGKGNVVLIHTFKEYFALLFFKGALLPDKKGLLVQQTENVQAARQMRFTSLLEVKKLSKVIRSYIFDAVKVEEAGLKVALKKTKEFAMPEEFKKRIDKNRALRTAFDALTPGRQRGYLLYFSSAKQSKTRESRIEKYLPKIIDGKGLDD